MFNARAKISKPAGVDATEFEQSVAQALFDLEATNSELKSELRDLYIAGAREIDISPTRKAVLIQVCVIVGCELNCVLMVGLRAGVRPRRWSRRRRGWHTAILLSCRSYRLATSV